VTRVSVTVLLVVLLAALVLFGAGAAATGRLPLLADVPADDAGDGLPEGPLRGTDLELARFPLAFRGYRMADVDRVLERLAGELTARDDEIVRLGAPPEPQHAAGPESQEDVRLAPLGQPGHDEPAGATRVGEPRQPDER